SSTVWTLATGEASASPAGAGGPARSPTGAKSVADADSRYSDLTYAGEPDDPPDARPVVAPPPPRLAAKPGTPASATPASPQASSRPEDRRKHARAKVKFKACIRRAGMPD